MLSPSGRGVRKAGCPGSTAQRGYCVGALPILPKFFGARVHVSHRPDEGTLRGSTQDQGGMGKGMGCWDGGAREINDWIPRGDASFCITGIVAVRDPQGQEL